MDKSPVRCQSDVTLRNHRFHLTHEQETLESHQGWAIFLFILLLFHLFNSGPIRKNLKCTVHHLFENSDIDADIDPG